jgi:ribosomal 50S subunit-recycling heat shock protein
MKGNEPILYFKMNLEKNLVMTRIIDRRRMTTSYLEKGKLKENNTKKKKKKHGKEKKRG